jgi:hypothetical protein
MFRLVRDEKHSHHSSDAKVFIGVGGYWWASSDVCKVQPVAFAVTNMSGKVLTEHGPGGTWSASGQAVSKL